MDKAQFVAHDSLLLGNKDFFLDKLVQWSWILIFIFSIFQCAFFFDYTNFICSLFVISAWYFVVNFILKKSIIFNYPFSSLLIIGYASTQFYFPLVFTSFEGKELIYNLKMPIEVFLHSFLSLLVILLSHRLYISKLYFFTRITRSFLAKHSFFIPPTDLQLILMGFIGLGAMFYTFLYSANISREVTGNPFDKFIQSIINFAYAPYLLFLGKLYNKKNTRIKNAFFIFIVFFSILIFIVSMGRNNRTTFILGFSIFIYSYIIGLLLGVFNYRIINWKNIFISLFAFWLFIGPLADMATAMVLVRGQRKEISYIELIQLTLNKYDDKSALELHRKLTKTEKLDWSEYYVSNVFLSRFANLKFNDNSLVDANIVGIENEYLQKQSIDISLAVLPSPLLKLFGIDIDKKNVNSSSFGDILHSRAMNDSGILGGFRSGHFTGSGMATFGWWYLLYLGILIIPAFIVYDSLFISGFRTLSSKPIFSVCALLSITTIYHFLPLESVINFFSYLIRGWFQMLFLYYFIFKFTSISFFKVFFRI